MKTTFFRKHQCKVKQQYCNITVANNILSKCFERLLQETLKNALCICNMLYQCWKKGML